MFEKFAQNLSCLSTTIKTIRRNIQNKKFESEVYVLDKFLTHGDICFDIGAAYGRYAYHFSSIVGATGQVYCFEPGDYSFKVLSRAVRFHRLNNVIKIKKALSDRLTTAELTIPFKGKNKMGPSLAHLNFEKSDEDGIHQSDVEVITLDHFVDTEGVGQINFIKCDVEGAEYLVFKGGRKTIERFHPVVLCEIDEEFLQKNNATPDEFFSYFYDIGYKSFIYKNNQFREVNRSLENHNYFFIPANSPTIARLND